MEDGVTTLAIYVVKLLRFCVLWIALYVAEKTYQDAYVTRVLVHGDPPPDLRPLVLYALLADFGFSVFVLVVLALLRANNPDTKTYAYALDQELSTALAVDYLASACVMAALGCGVAAVVQDRNLLRYSDDGLRSIRALGTLLLYGAMLTIIVPYYRLLL